MPLKHEAIVSRKDCYFIDPLKITILAGWNPRTEFGTPEDEELKADIIENGVLDPLSVKKDPDGNIVLLHGERRLRAVLSAIADGKEIASVPCFVERNTISDSEAMFINLSKMKGKPLNPIEEAEAFQRLRAWGVPAYTIAKRLGKSAVFVYKRLLLVDASEELKQEIKDKGINLAEAEKIILKSNGNVEQQKVEIEKTKEKKEKIKAEKKEKKEQVETETITVKTMSRDQMQDVLRDFEGRLDGDMTDYQDGYTNGVINTLKMVLANDEGYLDET